MKQLSKDEFMQLVESNEHTLIQFSANWCGPCKMLTKTLESMENEYSFRVAKVDIDQERELARTYGIRSVPTMIIFKDGTEIKRTVGNKPIQAIQDFMEIV
jgi:thioredoxin 1